MESVHGIYQSQSRKQKNPEKKLSKTRTKTNNKFTEASKRIEHQYHWWEVSDLITAQTLSPCIDCNGKLEIQFHSYVQFVNYIVYFCIEQNKNIESLLLEMNKQLSEVKDVLKQNKTKSKSK